MSQQVTQSTQRPTGQEPQLTPELLNSMVQTQAPNQKGQQTIETQTEQIYEMIVFSVAKQEYAVPITSVQEIILYQLPTRIPNAPSSIEGILNLRGKIIPVVNAYKRLGLKEEAGSDYDANRLKAASGIMVDDRIIVLQVAEQTIGIVVDAVSEVLHLSSNQVAPAPQQLAVSARFVTGIGKYQNRLLILLDPAKLIFDKDAE